MVQRTLIVIPLLLLSGSAGGSDATARFEQYHADVKQQARAQAIEEQQNRYCTEELKAQLGEIVNSPRDSSGNVQISAYQAWKLEETYKTCSTIKNPSRTTSMLLAVIPEEIKEHAREDMKAAQ